MGDIPGRFINIGKDEWFLHFTKRCEQDRCSYCKDEWMKLADDLAAEAQMESDHWDWGDRQ